MQKTITVPTHLTADQFGITDIEYFKKFLCGRAVPVVAETKGFITVQDANEEEWTVNKGDLQTKAEKI